MSLFKGMFSFLTNLKGRPMSYLDTITDTTYTVTIAQSNYFRDLQGTEEITFPGREYVISANDLDKVSAPYPQRNFRVYDPTFPDEQRTIDEVREMMGLKGELLGFRIRTN